MRSVIIGTAGHIDHGKTALIKALTGVDTDRLKEEKERGITTDLGFAGFVLPDGTRAGLIDVPGHEKFVGSMITGAGGLDLALLVIAADEGVMPQTREHRAILEELGITRGILVVNKCDLADRRQLDLIKGEIRREFRGTCFEKAPLAEVSALTGQGIPQLLEMIQKAAARIPEKEEKGAAWLPVDRVFTVRGFGTVVTGTLLSGQIRRGQEVTLYPSGLTCRVRGLQVYGEETEISRAGLRTAVNLADVEREQVRRGQVLTDAAGLNCGGPLDVKIHHSGYCSRPITNRMRMHLSLGTARILCRVLLLDRDALLPGESCFGQLLPEEPAASRPGERFILRYYSPVETVGGGLILNTGAVRRKRFCQRELKELERLEQNGAEGEARAREKNLERERLQSLTEFLKKYQETYPYRQGAPKSEILSRFFGDRKPGERGKWLEAWMEEGRIVCRENQVWLPGFSPKEDAAWRRVKETLKERAREAGLNFPRYQDVKKELKNIPSKTVDEIFQSLLRRGELVRLEEDCFTLPEILEGAVETLRPLLEREGKITIIQARDLLGTGRRGIRLLFGYTDSRKITKKSGGESVREANHDLF